MNDDSVLEIEKEDSLDQTPGMKSSSENTDGQPGTEAVGKSTEGQAETKAAAESMEGQTETKAASENTEGQPSAEAASESVEGQPGAEAASENTEDQPGREGDGETEEGQIETVITQLCDYITHTSVKARIAAGAIGLLVILLGIFAVLRIRKSRKKGAGAPARLPDAGGGQEMPDAVSVGKVHNIGRRQAQEDSFGIKAVDGGMFAVVADGMGGLSNGDKISQMVVMAMLHDANRLSPGPKDQILFEMVSHANCEVNRMLGSSEYYKSGSTLVAALVENDRFHWVSVGDSRIYLYRNQRLIQLNREHTYEAELLVRAVNGEIPFDDVSSNQERHGLTSFIGMGELKYIDGSRRGIRIRQGDRLLLMTDGVFHTASEEEMCRIIDTAANARAAAEMLKDLVLSYRNESQDNFTAVIIDL